MFDFSHTISIGEIFVGVSALCAGMAFLFRKGGDIAKLVMTVDNALIEISELKKEMSKMGQVLTQIAVQNERMDNLGARLNMMDRRYDELRRGQGWVTKERGSVDGEY